jgi:hypothetical protein
MVGHLQPADEFGLYSDAGRLRCPDDHEPIGVLAIGRPAPGGSIGSAWRGRRPLEQVAHRGHW